MTNYIAFDEDDCICGVGATQTEALIDAYGFCQFPEPVQYLDFSTVEATVELVVEVFRCGGDGVNWEIKDDGVADLEEVS